MVVSVVRPAVGDVRYLHPRTAVVGQAVAVFIVVIRQRNRASVSLHVRLH